MRLLELARVIRSKNAGPFELTFDIILKDRNVYERLKRRNFFSKGLVSRVLGIPEEDVLKVVYFDPVGAVKVTIKRPVPAGGIGDTDVYGAQQHVPFMEIEVPEEVLK